MSDPAGGVDQVRAAQLVSPETAFTYAGTGPVVRSRILPWCGRLLCQWGGRRRCSYIQIRKHLRTCPTVGVWLPFGLLEVEFAGERVAFFLLNLGENIDLICSLVEAGVAACDVEL